MDSFVSRVVDIMVGVVIALASGLVLRDLAPRPRVVYWPSHNFQFGGPGIPESVTTHAITVQNSGRKRAEAIQIAHASEPEYFQMWPQRVHTAGMRPSGTTDVHVIEVEDLGPNEWFTLEFLSGGSGKSPPARFLYIRSRDGYAQQVSVALQWAVPVWQRRFNGLVYVVGLSSVAYLALKALTFLWTALSVKR